MSCVTAQGYISAAAALQGARLQASLINSITPVVAALDAANNAIEIAKNYPKIELFQKSCPIWVPLIENGLYHSQGGKLLIKQDLDDLLALASNIDVVLLGCTHYPIISDFLESLTNNKVRFLSQGPTVAHSLKEYLSRHKEIEGKLCLGSQVEYFTTENSVVFDRNSSLFIGAEIKSSHTQIDTIQ
jgi:glutamate racemase